ncbi:MAG TPA: hypothetical protein VJN21_07985 [Candidatus Acidoferrales bacterium]|nr:hypothetical protein [Candidatus Acidoferrales bacterium]
MTTISNSGTIRKLAFTILAVSLMSGCYQRLGLYEVGGSSTAQTPGPVPEMGVTGEFTTGTATVRVNDGEVCKGQWRQVQTSADNPMASVWDEIYGQGYYVAHVLGETLYAEAVLKGNRGTTLTVEMYRPTSGDADRITPIRGIAKDNHGNIFKVAS